MYSYIVDIVIFYDRELLQKTFIPVSRIFDNKDENPAPVVITSCKRNSDNFFFKYYETSTLDECIELDSTIVGCNE